jgi:DNA polymerase III sliding clamp (beta) subunit (PCNA family)
VELAKFPVTKYQAHDNWIHFRTEEGVLFSVRAVLGEFKDIKWLFEETEKAKPDAIFKLPDDLKETLQIAVAMAEDEGIHTNVDISLKDNEFRCYAKKRRGEVERRLTIKYEREPVEFKINPKFLLQALDKTTTMSLRLNRAFISSGGFKHVFALIKPAETEDAD